MDGKIFGMMAFLFLSVEEFYRCGFRFGRRRWLEYGEAFSSRAPLAGLATDDGPWGMW
jgi:hypothetical protein